MMNMKNKQPAVAAPPATGNIQPGPMNIREIIQRTLDETKRSRYSLAMAVQMKGAANRETVLRYLRGDRDTVGAVIAAMLTELGLDIADAWAEQQPDVKSEPRTGKVKSAKPTAKRRRARA